MTMPSDDSMPLTIGCEAEVMNGPKLHFVIEFEFGEVRADHVEMWVRLRVERGKCHPSIAGRLGGLEKVAATTQRSLDTLGRLWQYK
jgi:hypothetical protein